MESTQLKLGREPRNDFERKIKEWEEKNVLVTLTREEREEEYQKALIELRDEMQEFIDTNYFDVSESMRERLMIRQALSLRHFIQTPEERLQRLNDATQWFENFIGRKIPIYNG